jgi:HTH-type transcriptional regulator/antitoxin HipB
MTEPVAQTEGQILKSLRIGAGLSQKSLAELIGISRETVVAIEGDYPETINALKLKVIKKWYDTCGAKSNAAAKKGLKSYLAKMFNI